MLLLQATSPLRTSGDLDRLCQLFEDSDADAIISLCRHEEPHPAKLQVVEQGQVRPFMSEGFEGPRQGLRDVYALNGAFYLIDRDVFLARRSFLPPRSIPFLMPPERSLNLDTMTDWHILNAMIEKGIWKLEEFPETPQDKPD